MKISFHDLMKDAEERNYAVGYFESWNLESLLAVCDAAEKMKSPVIVGFGGLFLTNKRRIVKDRLSLYANLADEVCKNISVPACTIFNESNDFKSVLNSVDHGYDIVMFVDSSLDMEDLIIKVSKIVDKAHKKFISVEAEIDELPGLDMLSGNIVKSRLTDPMIAQRFVSQTKVDALSINIGQSHKFGKSVNLDFERLIQIRDKLKIPLVLHGGSNINPEEISKAIDIGVRKFNLGGILKKNYFNMLRKTIANIKEDYNIYEILGSGFEEDILIKARLEVQKIVENYMKLYRSAGKAS